MIRRFAVTLSCAIPAAAAAQDTASVRLGTHPGYVRVVIESRTAHRYEAAVTADGYQGSVAIPEDLVVVLPSRYVAPVAAMTMTGDGKGTETEIDLRFSTPVALAHQEVIEPVGQSGYRIVLDYVPSSLKPAVVSPPAPPPVPTPAKPVTAVAAASPPIAAPAAAPPIAAPVAAPSVVAPVAAGTGRAFGAVLRLMQHGPSDADLRQALERQFGTDPMLIRMSYRNADGSGGYALLERAPFDDLGSTQIVYKLADGSGRLQEIDLQWGHGTGAGVSDADSARIAEALQRDLAAGGFVETNPEDPGQSVRLFVDGSGSGRRATLSRTVAVEGTEPAVRLDLLAAAGNGP